LAFFLKKKQCYDPIFAKTSQKFEPKNAKFSDENILKSITSVSGDQLEEGCSSSASFMDV
jgi:hypothetical protein